ncbi:MAG TPA: DUF350 domain-containing protein [Longimicrobium sp.]|nr:DUF350 domain-containing protein [Longimicrobium sp.]
MQIDTGALLGGVLSLVAGLFWIWLAKWVFDRMDGGSQAEITERSNLAAGLHRAGLYLAVPLGLTGALSGPSQGLARDLGMLMLDGAVLVVLLLVAGWINEGLLVPGVDNRRAIREGNTAVALVELGGFVATGLIARGAFSGEGGGVASAAVFFLLGQAVLVGAARLYALARPYCGVEEVRKGNDAAGVMVASMLIGLGVVLSASVSGDFTGWGSDLAAFGLAAAVGVVLLLVLLWPVDRLFMAGTNLRAEIERDRNVAAVSVVAGVQVALALFIAALFV